MKRLLPQTDCGRGILLMVVWLVLLPFDESAATVAWVGAIGYAWMRAKENE